MAQVSVHCVLDAPLEAVWAALMRPATLLRVAAPLVRFRPFDPPELPDRWLPGEYVLALKGFGVIPLGRQCIRIEIVRAEGPRRVLRDNGRGALWPTWDHRITLEAEGEARTRYRDEVEFDPLLPEPVAVALVRGFFRHRQRRWRRLVARGLPAG